MKSYFNLTYIRILRVIFMSTMIILGCVVGFKANCKLVGPGPIGGVPSVGGLSKGS